MTAAIGAVIVALGGRTAFVATGAVSIGGGTTPVPALLPHHPVTGAPTAPTAATPSAVLGKCLNAAFFWGSAVERDGELGAGTRVVFRATTLPAATPKPTVKTATGETVALALPIQP